MIRNKKIIFIAVLILISSYIFNVAAPTPPQSCGSSIGLCRTGTPTCVNSILVCGGTYVGPRPEICNNNLDEDCDRTADNGCPCSPNGAAQPCTSQDGICNYQQVCNSGVLGSCQKVDPQCPRPCASGTTQPCPEQRGVCSSLRMNCVNNVWQPCNYNSIQNYNQNDICRDGLDNNCNGQVDENCECVAATVIQNCPNQQGVCAGSSQTCTNNVWSGCNYNNMPGYSATEICTDTLDNNCNGVVNENCPCSPNGATEPCTSLDNICIYQKTCANGVWSNCAKVDPQCPRPCTGSATQNCPNQQGVCAGSIMNCVNNAWQPCNYNSIQNYNQNDICRDGLDNNCNGRVDEGCSCVPGERVSCGTNVGACTPGTKTCQSNGQFGECTGGQGPVTEVCDSLDNDCDGTVDETCECTIGTSRACGNNIGICRRGTQNCPTGRWGNCENQVTSGLEVCDNLDNDCNGTVDEGCSCTGTSSRSCGTNVGACRKGTQNCVAGKLSVCIGNIQPSSERCGDNVDNDCDGTVDEGCSCTSGQTRQCSLNQGVCSGINQTCSNSVWSVCNYNLYSINYQPQESSCNDGKDNDCDGKADNQDENCIQLIQTCTGGISYGSCDTNNKPKYCTYGRLEDRCTICGCPVGQQCRNSDGVCVTQQVTQTNLRGGACGNGNCEPGEVSTCPEDCAVAAGTTVTEGTTEVTEETTMSKISSLWWLWLLLIIFVIFGIVGYYYQNKGKKPVPGQIAKKEGFFEKIKNLFRKPPKQSQQQYVSPYAKYTQRYQWGPPK